MKSIISQEMKMKFPPIVLLKSDEKPQDAVAPKSGNGGCAMSFVAQTIAKRKTTCFGRENISCGGISAGFGWGSGLPNEDAVDFQSSFLSLGVESAPNPEEYKEKIENMPKASREMFRHGERIYCDFETAKAGITSRPIYDEGQYVIFKGLENLEEGEIPESVIFTVNPIELTVMIQINSSFRDNSACILTPQASSCQSIGCFTFRENESDNPNMVLGPVDFAGRGKMKHFIPNDYMNVSMPWGLFLKLEKVAENSVLQTDLWKNFTD